MKAITSHQNPKIKNILLLQEKSKERKLQNSFVVEGIIEFNQAIQNKYKLKELYICEELYLGNPSELPKAETYTITKSIFEKLAYRENFGGLIGVFQIKKHELMPIQNAAQSPLVLVLERMEKPGNIGAMLRTADAAGVSAVYICDSISDLYNPNTIRSSLGTIFTTPIVECSSIEAIQFLKAHKIAIVVTSLQATKSLYQLDLKKSCAIVMGEEHLGISDQWVQAADELTIIPMHGKTDSLNVSVSAGIALFEVRRQRTD